MRVRLGEEALLGLLASEQGLHLLGGVHLPAVFLGPVAGRAKRNSVRDGESLVRDEKGFKTVEVLFSLLPFMFDESLMARAHFIAYLVLDGGLPGRN